MPGCIGWCACVCVCGMNTNECARANNKPFECLCPQFGDFNCTKAITF